MKTDRQSLLSQTANASRGSLTAHVSVRDSFAGVGSTDVEAVLFNRRAICIEIDESCCAVSL